MVSRQIEDDTAPRSYRHVGNFLISIRFLTHGWPEMTEKLEKVIT
jgi:hypothetical protein